MPEQTGSKPEDPASSTGNEQDTRLADSTPNAGGPDRAAGEMGVSSQRVGPSGAADGERDTSEPPDTDDAGDPVGSDSDASPDSEENPVGIPPRAGYPQADPRHDERPYLPE